MVTWKSFEHVYRDFLLLKRNALSRSIYQVQQTPFMSKTGYTDIWQENVYTNSTTKVNKDRDCSSNSLRMQKDCIEQGVLISFWTLNTSLELETSGIHDGHS